MKRFAFRLERLERLRLTARRQAHATLAQSLGHARERQSERESHEASFTQALATDLPLELAGTAWALRGLLEWREGLRASAIAAAHREIAAFDAAIQAEHDHAEAARAHRVLERLHERRKDEWNQHRTREEQKQLDELYLLQRSREPEES